MFQKNKKLAIKIDILEFQNKKLIRVFKIEKKKRNKDKKLNLLHEKNNNSHLFFRLKVLTTWNFIVQIKNIEQNKKDMKKKE